MKIRCDARCYKICFEKNGFTIALFWTEEYGNISVKGNMFVSEGYDYEIFAELDESNSKYKNTYKSIMVKQKIDFSKGGKQAAEAFMSSFLTKTQVKNICETLENPLQVIEERDVKTLCTVKGIGGATALKILRNFDAQKDYSPAFVAWADYNLTDKMVKKICDHFGSVNEAIATVGANPYNLTRVPGIAFKKADWIFLSDPNNTPMDMRRIKAFTHHVFTEEFNNGNTWIAPRQLAERFQEDFRSADFNLVIEYIKSKKKYTVLQVGEQIRMCLTNVLKLELQVVYHLNRIMNAPSKIELGDIDKHIENVEKAQGWDYTDEQRQGINILSTQNVGMLQGLAGTGKSSLANAYLAALTSNGYDYTGCCLSGKAAENLSLVTGKKAQTIHTTLGCAGRSFVYNEKRPLPTNAVLLDELSMVNLSIFLELLRAIPDGAQLIMLGDFGQLPAIGAGVMREMIRSKAVPMTILKKIHRQAEKSAIITHSISLRNGVVPDEIDRCAVGKSKVYGQEQDLEYVLVEDDSEILSTAIRRYGEMLKEYPAKDIQILCPTRAGVKSLNLLAQQIANPASEDKDEIELSSGKDDSYFLRLGDKVINVTNNRSTKAPNGIDILPIFNGNTGIITNVEIDDEAITVDFDGIGEVLIAGDDLKSIELGYAMTIHKSQGSTIPCVIYALPYHFLLNSRESIYTGMTRAKNYQIVVTKMKSLVNAAGKSSTEDKQTNLEQLLANKDLYESLSKEHDWRSEREKELTEASEMD